MARIKMTPEQAEAYFRKHPYGQKQYDREAGPDRPTENEQPRKSAMDRIKERAGQEFEYYTGVKPSTVARAARHAKEFAGAMGEAVETVGASSGARQVRHYAERMNSSDNLGGSASPPAAGRIRQQPRVEVNPGSSMHPRVSIIVQGKLVGPARGQQNPPERQKSRRRGGGDSGLSGDQFFGNDRGL